jgi:dynein light intermediate chain 1
LVCLADQTRLGAWLLDGDLHHRGLLKFALNEGNFAHTVVLLVASLSTPWNIMETLQCWAEVLSTHIERLKLPKDELQEYKESCEFFCTLSGMNCSLCIIQW